MNCKKCGFQVTSLDQFCPNCGEPNEFYVNQTQVPNQGVSAPVPPVVPTEPVQPEVTPVATPETPVVQPEQVVVPAPEPVPTPAPTPVSTPEPVPTPVPPVVPTEPVQQTMPNQGMNPSVGISQSQITPTKEKKNTGFILLVIFLLLIIAGLGVFIGIRLLGGDDSNSGGNSGGSGSNSGGGVQPVEVDTSSTISLGGYDFTIPSGVEKKTIDGYTALVDKTNNYMIYLQDVYGSISLSSAKQEVMAAESQYKTNLESKGATYIGMNDYYANGYNYFVVSYSASSVYGDQFMTNIGGTDLILGEVAYTSVSKDAAYQTLAKILNSAKESTASSFAPSTGTTSDIINKGINVISSLE